MSTTVLDILLRSRDQASPDIKKMGDAIEKADKKAKKASEDGFEALRKKLKDGLVAATAAVAGAMAAMAAAIVDAVKTASHIEEMASQFNVAFGEIADTVREQLGRMAADMNRSKFEFEEYASAFQLIFTPMGMTRSEASKLSVELTGLTADIASFFDAAESDVLMNLKSALVGEQEAVRKYGIILNETTVKEELARMGKEDLTGAALEQAKVMARLNLIWAQTKDAQGDAARTAGSFANVMRGLGAALLDVRAGIGQEILPHLTPFMQALTELIRNIGPNVIAFFAELAGTVAKWAEDINLVGVIENIISAFVAFGRQVLAFVNILYIAIAGGNDFGDWFAYFPERAEPFLRGLVSFIRGVREFISFLWTALAPVRAWIAEHVSLGDVLAGLGAVIVRAVLPVLGRFVAAWTPVLLAIGGAIAVVSLLRNAWESDWLGLRTAFQPMVDAIARGFQRIVGVVREVMADGHITSQEWGRLWTVFKDVAINVLSLAWQGIKAMFGNIIAVVRDFFAPYWHRFTEMFPQTAATLKVVWADIAMEVRELWTALQGLFTAIGNGWKGLVDGWIGFTSDLTGNTENARGVLDNIFSAIAGIIDLFVTTGVNTLTLLIQLIQGDWKGAWETAKQIVSDAKVGLGFVFDQLLQAGRSLWSGLVQAVQTNWPAWSAALAEWGKAIAARLPEWIAQLKLWGDAAWKWITETAIPNTIKKIGEWWNVLRGFVTEHWPAWKARLGEWASAAWEWIRDVAIPNVLQWLGNLWTGFREWGRTNLPEWVNILLDWAEVAWVWIRDTAIPNITTWMTTLIGNLTSFFSGPGFQVWKTRIEEWWGIAKEFFTVTVPEWLRILSEKWEEAKTKIGGAIDYLKETFGPLYTAVTENLGPALAEIQAFLTGNETSWENTKELWQGFKDTFTQLWEDIKANVLEPMRQWFEKELPHTYQVTAGAIGDFKKAYAEALDEIGKATEDATLRMEKEGPARWKEFWDTMLAGIINMFAYFGEQILYITAIFTAAINGDWEEMWRLNNLAIEQGGYKTLEAIELQYKAQLAATGSHKEDMTKVFEAIGAGLPVGFSKGVESKIEEVRNSTARMADETLEEYGKRLLVNKGVPSKVFEELGELNVQGLINGLNGSKQSRDILAAARKMGEDTEKGMKDYLEMRSPSQKMVNIGLDVLRGLIDGLIDPTLVARLMAEARSLAQRILTTIRSALNIKSPSGETYGIGEFVVQGLMEGILSQSANLGGLMNSLGGNMMNSLSSGLETGRSVVQMQLEALRNQVQNGANNISNAFNSGIRLGTPSTPQTPTTPVQPVVPTVPLTGDQIRDAFQNPSGLIPGREQSAPITGATVETLFRDMLRVSDNLKTNLQQLVRLDDQTSGVEMKAQTVVANMLDQILAEFDLVRSGAKSAVDVNKVAPLRDMILSEFNNLIGQGNVNQDIVGRFTEQFREFVGRHLQEAIAPQQGASIWDFVAKQWEKVGIDFNKEVLPLIRPGMTPFQVANMAMELLRQKGINETNPLNQQVGPFNINLTPTGNDNQDIYNTIQTFRAAYG